MNNIKKVLQTKQNVVVKYDDEYAIISNIRPNNYGWTGWRKTIEETKRWIGCYSIDESNFKDWEIVDAFDFEQPSFKGIDKVLILPNAKEECEKEDMDWNEKKEEMVGGVFEVKKVFITYCNVWNKDKSDYWSFPKSCLSYPFEEIETIKIGNKEYDKKEFEEATKNLKPIN
jgi:hypothetical protein